MFSLTNDISLPESGSLNEINPKDFTFSQERIDERFGLIFYMKSKSSVQTVCVKERNVSIPSDQFNDISTRSKITDDHLLKLYGVKQEFGTNSIQVYFEEFSTDLKSEIERHLQEKTRFSEAELYSILYSSISALSCLEQHSFSHDFIVPMNILKFRKDLYKLHDNFTIANKSCIYSHALRGQYLRFIPPELLPSLIKKNERPEQYDRNKSDIFSLGICMLDAGLLNSQGDFINKKLLIIDENQLQQALKKFSTLYSSSLTQIIQDMLCQDPSKRPNAITLFQRLPGRPIAIQPKTHASGKKRKLLDQIINDVSPKKLESHGTSRILRKYQPNETQQKDESLVERNSNIMTQKFFLQGKTNVPYPHERTTENDLSRVNVSDYIKNDPVLSQFAKRLSENTQEIPRNQHTDSFLRSNQLENVNISSQPLDVGFGATTQEFKYSNPFQESQGGKLSVFNPEAVKVMNFHNSVGENLNTKTLSSEFPLSQAGNLQTYHLESVRDYKGDLISNLGEYQTAQLDSHYNDEFEGVDGDNSTQSKIDDMIAKALERSSTNLYLSQKVSNQLSSSLSPEMNNKNDMTMQNVHVLSETNMGGPSNFLNPKIVESSRFKESPLKIVDYSNPSFNIKGFPGPMQKNHFGEYFERQEVNTPGFK